jgi:hypothetical protein
MELVDGFGLRKGYGGRVAVVINPLMAPLSSIYLTSQHNPFFR